MSQSEQNGPALSPRGRSRHQHAQSQPPILNSASNLAENSKENEKITKSQIEENKQKLKLLEQIKKRKEQLIEHSNYFENNSIKSQIIEKKQSKQSEISIFNQIFKKESPEKPLKAQKQNFRIVNGNQIEFVNLKNSTAG